MVKVKYDYRQFCYGNSRDYYRSPKTREREFSTEKEAQDFIDNLNRINKQPNNDKYDNIELLKESCESIRIELLNSRLKRVQQQLETAPAGFNTSRLEIERDKIMDELNELERPKTEDYVPAPDEDEYGNTDLDYGEDKESEQFKKEEYTRLMNRATKRFEKLCDTTCNEYLLTEEGGIEGWTLRDFVSEAQYQANKCKDSDWYDSDNKREYNMWSRFVAAFAPYLTDEWYGDIKCKTKHISKYDK